MVSDTTVSVDGLTAMVMNFPGEGWGGLYFQMEEVIDASSYSDGHLKFAAKLPEAFRNAEVKLESSNQETAHQAYLINYEAVDIGDGWVEYSIPFADLTNLDITNLSVPFAFWNPIDDEGEFLKGIVLIDNVRLTID